MVLFVLYRRERLLKLNGCSDFVEMFTCGLRVDIRLFESRNPKEKTSLTLRKTGFSELIFGRQFLLVNTEKQLNSRVTQIWRCRVGQLYILFSTRSDTYLEDSNNPGV